MNDRRENTLNWRVETIMKIPRKQDTLDNNHVCALRKLCYHYSTINVVWMGMHCTLTFSVFIVLNPCSALVR